MKKLLQLVLISLCFSSPALAQNWNDSSRTFTRNDAGAWGPGIKSGFYQTQNPVNFPSGATGWWHLLDVRQNDSTINYAMQFAGNLFDQNLYYRKTNGESNTAWSRVLMESGSSTLDNDTMRMSFSKFAGGGWMNLPTGGPSGIGSGGPGKNAWIGYASGDNMWFPNSNQGDICYRNTLGKMLFGNSANTGAVMAVTGNKVGIGTLTPSEVLSVVGNIKNSGNLSVYGNIRDSGNLMVYGNITAKRLQITQAPWADYVFEPSYKLPTLKEVEEHITKHKHLPDVPSAKQVEAEGIDVGASQAMLLRKIEELTLYVIKQNKQLELQQSQVDELREQMRSRASSAR